ncbi:ACP S-malonyltransferase [Saccharopolyspora sp. 5N708]|uniref:ACP S-malonyltransferase n=1 Tax=Saccharopolyspora sp. 5N708 TaxID=3457424 RepID=UPI003FD082D7
MSLALLFPGQGSQRPGMLHALPDSPAVRSTLADAGDHIDLDRLDTEKALRSSTDTQLALLLSGVAAARALTDDHGLSPEFVAGHSVGAFAAAVTAGVLTLPEALTAVRLRGDLMREVCADGRWGMAAIIGLRLPTVRSLTEQVSTHDDPLWIANINAQDQIVVSGTSTALRRAEPAVRDAGGGRVQHIDVTVASHCPLQERTAIRLAEHLARLPRRPQRAAYLTNTGGRCVRADSDAVLDDLGRAVARPVQWHDATRLMSELGATYAVQLPPGDVLSRLLLRTLPQLHADALEDGIHRVLAHSRRYLGAAS